MGPHFLEATAYIWDPTRAGAGLLSRVPCGVRDAREFVPVARSSPSPQAAPTQPRPRLARAGAAAHLRGGGICPAHTCLDY